MTMKPIFAGAVSGLLSAMIVDYQAFRAWATQNVGWDFSWRVALTRWAFGAVSGALAALGLGGVQS